MKRLQRSSRFAGFTPTLLEALESREFLSVATSGVAGVVAARPSISISTASAILSGTKINAQAGQAFRAVLGSIQGLYLVPTAYTLQGSINWGDGTANSDATFTYQSDGSILVLGAHTYAQAGTDNISILLTSVPPAGTLLPVRIVGTIKSTAAVITPNGGVTLNQTAGVEFTANLGTFRSRLSVLTMTAVITWGDGTQTVGKIYALPTANPLAGGSFAVMGTHTYATTGSYLVHITVFSSALPPIGTPTAVVPPVILVAQWDSVIDVLPRMPVATA